MNREKYEELINYLNGNILKEWDKRKLRNLLKESEKFETEFGILLRRKKNGQILRVLKEDEIDSVMFMTHNHPTGGHLGKNTVYDKISTRFWWKGMYKDIEKYLKTCDSCQRRGNKGGTGYLNPIKVRQPFERIGIDFVGPLERTKKGNRYILVMTDYLTKWPEAEAMKEATADNVIQFIYEKVICRHGCPKIILSDRGAHFRNKLVDGLCEKFKVKHKLSSPYHPETNGLVERFNRTLCESLAKVSEKENEWDKHIESVLFAYRTAKHNTTKRTPFFMVYGREAILPIENLEINEDFGQNAIMRRTYELIELTEERSKALRRIEISQGQQKRRHDDKIKRETILKIGDKVLLKDAAKEKQWSGKLSSKWKGPYYIHEIIGKGVYKLRTIEGQVLKTCYNIKHLKKYYDQRERLPQIFI
ncbi:MAG TPA: DDE-type integrase/transposase/recombinase [Bacillus sp. (in: firmicutes)]|nr:DDE-type integrase/transposase/recombinase [Bacillus sp. (in: firmicutes)]